MRHYLLPLLITCLSLAAAGCEKKEAVKPPDLGINVTTTEVIKKDRAPRSAPARRFPAGIPT